MIDEMIHKLSNCVTLSSRDKDVLRKMITKVVDLEKNTNVKREEEKPDFIHLLMNGWACRYKTLENGKEYIVGFLLPGDLSTLNASILTRMDHSIRTLTRVKLALIPQERIDHIHLYYPNITRAFFWSTLLDESILREWLVSQGGRPAAVRLAHLFCEIMMRSRAAGLTDDYSFYMPLTQEELGNATGLTKVHVNRCLRHLRMENLIEIHRHRVSILDWERLQTFGEFQTTYLHMPRIVADLSLQEQVRKTG
ncbi:Crp/Fnr family transcriptional regulator [Pistricoccus aurantiacus]|uniref:Crp/Fnr family transcriptional regulator n=1 Tax=Pistricoccus aurantiacus TaxID=1883414 RepID=UPI00364157E1